MGELSIRDWRELPEKRQGIAVVFDVFRCSTTVQCLHHHRPGNLWVARSLDALKTLAAEFRIFSELPDQLACHARYDNSPAAALGDDISVDADHPFVVATTSGTPAMFAARDYNAVLVGALTNFSALVEYLATIDDDITLIPAAKPDSDHVEDNIVAQAVAVALNGYCDDAEFIRRCAEQSATQIRQSGRPDHLTERLPTGAEDMALALEIDRYRKIPRISFQNRGPFPGAAEVV